MTSIKPTSGPVTTPSHTVGSSDLSPASALDGPQELSQTSEAQRTGDLRSVASGHVAAPNAADQAGGVQQVNLVDLAKAVEAGELTMGQAVERLVEGSLGSLPRQLTELERTELSQLLRQAVQNDPTLGALQDEPA
jgi:hypothetical protein